MLREDKRAHIEKQLENKTPVYEARLPPKSTWERMSQHVTSPRVTGWKETYVYELSSGKPAPTARARTYMSVKLSKERFDELSAAQLHAPVLVTTWEGKQWWWFLNRFWWDAEGLTPADVQALILQREQKKQATLERARNQALGIETKGAGLEVSSQRIRDFAERDRKQRLLQERRTDVEGRNESLAATTSALENLLIEALDRGSTVEFDPDDGDPDGLVSYFSSVLDASPYPEGFPKKHRVAFVPESRQLVVEYELPTLTIVPAVKAYKYVASRSAIDETPRPATQSRALYSQVVAQTALRTLHELFQADRGGSVETIVLNCFVDTIDPATGQPTRPCLITVRTSRETFQGLNLRQVDPSACLRGLRAVVSRSPHELLPVRPILSFDMVDPRFIQDSDVLGDLDDRPNLMELNPKEFEALISNLFEKMGLDTRQTQASRDGGVDCVAWDHRPIFGGKVIIQAKRYKNTVGVSAVRDLFGTMQNEGASKGILVTTSGYGRSSFDFAEGKPLELLSGSNLLYLLSEHAGIEARIEPPEDWVDPVPDVETTEPPVSQ